jgi:hypothetical protein
MISLYFRLGLAEESGFYKVTEIEQTVDTISLVGDHNCIMGLGKQFYPILHELREEHHTVAKVFVAMTDALAYLR